MKRLLLLALAIGLLAGVMPTFAQTSSDVITLNDATPAIDAVISLPADTSGAVALDFNGAAVRLTDANGNIVFQASDARLHGLTLNIAPNTGSHTLTVERLPGLAVAAVRVTSLPEMQVGGAASQVTSNSISLNQETSLPLNAAQPGGSVLVFLPTNTTSVLTATFPGATATTQIVDATGLIVAESANGHVDGINLVLDGGNYQFTVLGNQLTTPIVAGVRAVPSSEAGVTVMAAPTATTTTTVAETTNNPCLATVVVTSGNMRSGPGTGYSILGYNYLGEVYTVGGQNPEHTWYVIGTNDGGSAWVAGGNIQMQGGCDSLTEFNIPLRNASAAPLVFSAPGSTTGGTFFGGESEEHEGAEHEGGGD